MRRVAAHQRDDDPGSEERRLGAPALLREVSPTRARQENAQQGRQQRGDPEHGRGEKRCVVTRRTEKDAQDEGVEGRAVVLCRL